MEQLQLKPVLVWAAGVADRRLTQHAITRVPYVNILNDHNLGVPFAFRMVPVNAFRVMKYGR